MTDDDLLKLQALCDAATPGEWFAGEARNPNWLYAGGGQYSSSGWQIGDMQGARCSHEQDACNARFIAAARTALPELIAEVRRLRASLDHHKREMVRLVAPDEEVWREIPNYTGYEVSNLGDLRSWNAGVRRRKYPRLAARHPNNRDGYYFVALTNKENTKTVALHRLVLTVFVGPCPHGHEGAHLNGDRTDNRACNLAWVTRQDNLAQVAMHGKRSRGPSNGNTKLTESDVISIRQERSAGESLESLAKRFGVTATNVRSIVKGETWRQIPMPDEAELARLVLATGGAE